MGARTRDLAGLQFGRFVVTGQGPSTLDTNKRWWCRCTCGEVRLVWARHLISGRSQSCGCLSRERTSARTSARNKGNTKHGLARRGEAHPLYSTWASMVSRCINPKDEGRRYYFDRGIRVCARWRHDFPSFLVDMGPRPSPRHSLDRIDNDGDYEPGNCRWATASQQQQNKGPYRKRSA